MPLDVIMLFLLATQMYQAAELEMDTQSSHIHVPNIPKIGRLTRCGLPFFSNSRLLRYYNPVHPSPLAFILLSLGFFLLGIALSFRVVICSA
jgi:hypothetical protein